MGGSWSQTFLNGIIVYIRLKLLMLGQKVRGFGDQNQDQTQDKEPKGGRA